MKKDKANRVSNEVARIGLLFNSISEQDRAFIAEQVNQLAWYNVSIKDLQTAIDKKGSTVEYSNGATQYGSKRNPDIDTLVQYQKQAVSIAKHLAKFIKDEDSKPGNKLTAILRGEDWPV